MIRFIPVRQVTDPLTVTLGLSGTSGTGKTYTALRVARGMAEVIAGGPGAPIGYVDDLEPPGLALPRCLSRDGAL
jgi:hypothetical protein